MRKESPRYRDIRERMNSQPAKASAFADAVIIIIVGEGRRFRWLRIHSLSAGIKTPLGDFLYTLSGADLNHDFAEMRAAIEIFVGGHGIFKSESAIDHRLNFRHV